MFERVKRFYNQGLWSKYQVWAVVSANAITPQQYEEIVGEPYNPNIQPSNTEFNPNINAQ